MDGIRNTKAKIVVAVYNPIEYDGRVKRSCETLAQNFEVKLFCTPSENSFHSDTYEITRCSNLKHGTSPALRLLWFWLGFIRFVWQQKPQLVYAHDFFLTLPGLVAAKLVGAASVYDAHELIAPEVGQRISLKEKLFYVCEKATISRHQLVIAANVQRAQIMLEHYKLKILPVVIRNITKPTYCIKKTGSIVNKYPLLRKAIGDIHIIYMGDINLARGLESIINAIYLLPFTFKLILVGDGQDLVTIKRIAATRNSDQLRIIGGIPNEEIQNVIGTGDIGVICYNLIGLNNIYCSPNKIFEYAQAGLPIISTCQPPLKQMIKDYGIGAVVGCESPVTARSYANAIRIVASTLEHYRFNVPTFLQDHQFEVEQEKLSNAIIQLLNGREGVK